MERRGVYRKGSSGHVRNASAYRIDVEHHKQWARKWRFPLTALVAVLVLLGTAPVVGDALTASILTLPETKELIASNPVSARKVLLDETARFSGECKRLGMDECADRGSDLVNALADDSKSLDAAVPELEAFFADFEPRLSSRACQFDLANTTTELKKQSAALNAFTEEFSGTSEQAGLDAAAEELQGLVEEIAAFVAACK